MQENDPIETIERMISFALGSEVDLAGSDVEEMVRLLCEAYSTETCKFSFKYRQNRSISTADVADMIQDEYMDGNEVVMVIHDYIKRIKSVEQFKDARHLELGAIVDEESSIAKMFGIPFVTGMQLNREAYAKVEAALKAGKTDAVKELGASQVGESINVFENADVVIFQSRIYMESIDKLYLTITRAKMRGKRVGGGGSTYFAQPFAVNGDGDTNEMLLAQDAHLSIGECMGLKDLGDGLAEYDANAAEPGGTTSEQRRGRRNAAAVSPAGAAAPRTPPRSGGAPARRAILGPARATLTQVAPPAGDDISTI